MISYEVANSPFFEENKTYCEQIESSLNAQNIDCTGWCNSYGYELNSTFVRNNLSFKLQFQKFQTTQNGVVIPVEAHSYAGIEMSVSGLRKSVRIAIGQSGWKRLFTAKKYTEKFPYPYYVKINHSPSTSLMTVVLNKITTHKISKLTVSDGVLTCKIHAPTTNALGLISDIEVMTTKWI